MDKYSKHSSNLSSDALREIEAPVIKAKPFSHQVQALADIKKTFAKHDRATVVMAAGLRPSQCVVRFFGRSRSATLHRFCSSARLVARYCPNLEDFNRTATVIAFHD